jgi:hypothetical protein
MGSSTDEPGQTSILHGLTATSGTGPTTVPTFVVAETPYVACVTVAFKSPRDKEVVLGASTQIVVWLQNTTAADNAGANATDIAWIFAPKRAPTISMRVLEALMATEKDAGTIIGATGVIVAIVVLDDSTPWTATFVVNAPAQASLKSFAITENFDAVKKGALLFTM